MASSELLPPAPLATACDADGVLGSPAEKRGEGSPEEQHASFTAWSQFKVWEKSGLSRSGLDQQRPQSKSFNSPTQCQLLF